MNNFALLALGGLTLGVATVQRGSPKTETPAELFRNNCSMCHAAPDTRFETDRAWVAQLPLTA